MSLKNLFKLSTIVFLFTIVLSSLSYGQTVRYLNSTDGDDSYTGLNPTNNPLGSGPMRTLEGAFSAFPDGATVYMTAGSYHFPSAAPLSDADGYVFSNIPPAAGKSMTYIIQTYNSNNVATLDGDAGAGNDGFKLDIGTGVLKFMPTTAGVQSVVLNPATNNNNLNLLSGTLDISAMGAAGFTIGTGYNVINVTAGTIVGTPVFPAVARTLNYTNTGNLVAGGEVPSLLGTLNLSATAASKTVTFNNAINFGYSGGGIFTTTNTSGVFNGAVLLYVSASEAGSGLAITPSIKNNNTGTLTFGSGGLTVRSNTTPNDPGGAYNIWNASTGKIIFNGPVVYTQFDAGGTGGTGPIATDLDHVSTIYNALSGTLTIQGGLAETATAYDATGATSDYSAAAARTPQVNIVNNSTGPFNLGGATVATTITGTWTDAATAGTVNVNGPVTLKNVLSNGATHTIALGSNTLTITKTSAAHLNNGNITSSGVGNGLLVFNVTGATSLTEAAGTGQLPNLQKDGAGLLTLNALTYNGNITSNRGGITFTPWSGNSITCTNGLLTINAPSAGTNVVTAAPDASSFKGLTMNGGGYSLPANSTTRLTGDYNQNGGTLTWGATSTLNCKANFIRNAGAVVVGAGSDFTFTGGINQTFSGGTNMTCWDFTINTTNTSVTFINGSLVVDGDFKIISNTTVNLGTYNVVMLGSAAGANTFTNTGNVTATAGGGLIFKGPFQTDEITANAPGYFNWTGNGVISNVDVRLLNPLAFVDITNGNNGQVNFSGVLTLTSGTVRINAGNSFNPTNTYVTSTIRRNMADANTDGFADGAPINLNTGTFNVTNNNYNLEYFSVGSAAVGPFDVGPEFVLGSTAKVVNLTVSATTRPVNFPVGGLYSFSGNLQVNFGAGINLSGAAGNDDLVSTGTAVTHSIIGTVQNSGPGTAQFVLAGDGTINGGTSNTSSETDPAAVTTVLNLNTASTLPYNINNLKTISTMYVTAGTGNLGMQAWGSTPTLGTVTNFNLQAGKLTLTKDANFGVGTFVMVAGATFDFANQNLYVPTAGATFGAVSGGTFAATGATTKGWLVFQSNSNLNTGSVLVPRIQLAKAGTVVTLTGNSGVSDIFQDYDSTPNYGTLALGANTFVVGGGTWNAGGSYTGTGKVQVTGATNVNLVQGISVPNVELKNVANTATLVNNTGTGTPPSLTVTGTFTSTSGNLALGLQDVILTGTAPFTYAAGMFTATNSNTITASNNANGEFVFDNVAAQTFSVSAAGLIFPNVRVNNTGDLTLAGSPNNLAFTISNRLVLANTGRLVVGTAGLLTIGDGALIKRANNAGVLDVAPTFATANVDVQYEGAAAIVPAKEIPSTLAVRNLYVNMSTGIAVTPTKSYTVNGMLYLYNGNYDFEATAGTINTLTMGASSTVNVKEGNLINSGSTTVTPLVGLGTGATGVTMIYSNAAFRATTAREYPTTAGFVNILKVQSNDGVGGNALLQLDASRSCGDFLLNTGKDVTTSPAINNVRFDLNGNTLTVTNTSSATLTRGTLSSEKAPAGTSTYNVAGALTSSGTVTGASTASIQNVNVTAVTLTLAGPFGQTTYAPATTQNPTWASVSGVSTVASFSGSLTSVGAITLNGPQTNGTVTATDNITVGTGGSFNSSSYLSFVGAVNATLKVQAGTTTIGGLTINKTNNNNTVTISTGSITASNTTTFKNGLLVTGSNVYSLFVPAFGFGQGFDRTGVTGSNISHIVGNVGKTLYNRGTFAAGACEPRQEFPIGSLTEYHPLALNFNTVFGNPNNPNTTLVVNYAAVNPQGAVGLPIANGIAPGIDIGRYPAFYWSIKANPSVGPSAVFDLELTATGYTGYDDINNIRIIRRYGTTSTADLTNEWNLQGFADQYDNASIAGVPIILQKNANAGLISGGALFTLGLKSNLSVKTQIPKQWLVKNATFTDVRTISLANTFKGNVGTLSYLAQSSNLAVASAAIPHGSSTVQVSAVNLGDCIITVTAIDATTNDFFAYSFPVNVGPTDVAGTEQLPTEYALLQNFPNPFNPTTNIRFDLPKESNVTLKIYNILGEEVATLVDKVMPAGHQSVTFDATKLASGMYIYRINAADFTQVKKMLLMK